LHANEVTLKQILITEGSKAYLTNKVDVENKLGFFQIYKRVVKRISDIILEINPTYLYSQMLVILIYEGAQKYHFFAEQPPALTNITNGCEDITTFYNDLVFKMIHKR